MNQRYYEIWLELTGGGPNHEYIAWNNRMAAEWRRVNRLPEHHPVHPHLFEPFLEGKLARHRAGEAA